MLECRHPKTKHLLNLNENGSDELLWQTRENEVPKPVDFRRDVQKHISAQSGEAC